MICSVHSMPCCAVLYSVHVHVLRMRYGTAYRMEESFTVRAAHINFAEKVLQCLMSANVDASSLAPASPPLSLDIKTNQFVAGREFARRDLTYRVLLAICLRSSYRLLLARRLDPDDGSFRLRDSVVSFVGAMGLSPSPRASTVRLLVRLSFPGAIPLPA